MAFASKSPWVIHYDGSSCNDCDIEVLATLCPGFVVREIYDQMLEPKVVVACGICACTGGVFHDCYNVIGGVDKAIPVDVYAPGCAVRPEQIIDAVVAGVAKLDEKSAALAAAKKGA